MGVFVDAGDAAKSFGDMSLAVGYGVGARVRTPAGPCSWTWPMASATAACDCISPWGSRFEDVARDPAPSSGVVAARAGDAGGAGLRFPVLAGRHAERHAPAADHGGAAAGRPGAGRARFGAAWPERGTAGARDGRHARRNRGPRPESGLARAGPAAAARARAVGRGRDGDAGAGGCRRDAARAGRGAFQPAVAAGGYRAGPAHVGRIPSAAERRGPARVAQRPGRHLRGRAGQRAAAHRQPARRP